MIPDEHLEAETIATEQAALSAVKESLSIEQINKVSK
jgi:hypothetical protein